MFFVFLFIIVGLVVYIGYVYNNFKQLKNKIDEEWGSICASIMERFKITKELIDSNQNIGYNYEEINNLMDNLQKVTNKNEFVNEFNKYEEKVLELTNIVNKDINANTLNNLNNAHNKIEYIRKFYNEDVNNYNKKIDTFPTNIVAGVSRLDKEFNL